MTNEEFNFILEDRIAKIQAINQQNDLINNSYIAFSGGKDSVVLSHLIDLALQGNKIPRIYANTGIEYNLMVKYVRELARTDSRIQIINQTRNIKRTLETYGYPFKSKEFSLRVEQFNKGSNAKFIKKYIDGWNSKFQCPKSLLYIFENRGKYHYSNKCCYKLKKDLMPHDKIVLTGMRNEEGGNRERLGCTIFEKGKLKKFHPLIVVSSEWEEWFIDKYQIKLCPLYYSPYNMIRTGCKGCPYNIHLQDDLDMMGAYLPNERKQCEIIWKPVYDEYRRTGYRLNKNRNIFDFLY